MSVECGAQCTTRSPFFVVFRRRKNTKLLHGGFLTMSLRKVVTATTVLECFKRFLHPDRHPTLSMDLKKPAQNHPENTSMKASYPTSDSQFLRELPVILCFCIFVKSPRCRKVFCWLMFGPFLHEMFLFLSS